MSAHDVDATGEAGAFAALAPTPYPPDLEERLTAYAAEQTRLAAKDLAQEEAALGIVSKAIPEVRRVAQSFEARFTAIREARRVGSLTQQGVWQGEAALRAELQPALQEVFGPLQQRLAEAEQHYAQLVAMPPVSEEDEGRAIVLADQLARLTPAHGLPRVAKALRDAVKTGAIGPVRALGPVLKSLVERPGTGYHSSAELLGLIQKSEALLRGWQVEVGERRLAQLQHARWQFEELKQAALETDGQLEQSMTFRMLDGDGRSMLSAPR